MVGRRFLVVSWVLWLVTLAVGMSSPVAAEAGFTRWVVAFEQPLTEAAARSRLAAFGGVLEGWQADSGLALVRMAGGQQAAATALRLETLPGVAYATAHRASVEIADAPLDERWGEQWGPQRVQAPLAWDLAWGDPDTLIAIIDTGAHYEHVDLASQIWINPGESELDAQTGARTCDGGPATNGLDDDGNGYVDDCRGYDLSSSNDPDPMDNHQAGHGTAVAGIAGAAVNNPALFAPGEYEGIAGLGRRSRLMIVKAMEANGSGYPYNIAQAILYAAHNGARVINLSLTLPVQYAPDDADILCRAIDAAHAEGALVVAASGNHYAATVTYPAACPGVVAVGASSRNDTRALFSDYGARLDLVAPGEGILSTLRTTPLSYGYYNSTGAGTSFAAPHVAGVAALVRALRPDLIPAEVRELLRTTTDDVAATGFDTETGMGRLNARRAVDAALAGVTLSVTPAHINMFPHGTTSVAVAVHLPDGQLGVAGARITFSCTNGVLTPSVVTTDATGQAYTQFVSNGAPGEAEITAHLGELHSTAMIEVGTPHYLPLVFG